MHLILRLILFFDYRKPLILLRLQISPVRTSAPCRRKWPIACGDFFTKVTSALILLRLLFRKRSRQVARLTCKRARCRFVGTNLFRFVRFAHLKTLDFTVFFLKFCNTIRRIFLSKYGFTLPNAAPFSQKSSFASAMSLQAQNITSTLHYHFFAIFCALRT